MMHAQKAIEKLGYKPNEARVYMTMLSLGESTVSDIANKLGMPRTSTQAILDKLRAGGLSSFYIKRRYRYWTAESPERLLSAAREREASLQTILPELNALRRKVGNKPTVKIYSGREEIKLIHSDILATKHHVLGIIPWEDWIEFFGPDYVEDFIKNRAAHFIKIKLLTPRSPAALAMRARDDQELRVTRFLPPEIDIRNSIFIYADKVALISLNSRQPTGILIDDPETRHTLAAFFQDLWRQGA